MKNKLRAWGTHLLISAAIVIPVLLIIYFVWFPAPYFEIQGTLSIVLVLIGVDLVLGPLLTFIIYRPGKPGLKFDLWVIALLQVSALVYGTISIYSERPMFMVFALDRFEVLASKDVDFDRWGMTGFGVEKMSGPQMIFAEMPTGEAEQALLDSIMFQGLPDIERRPEFWRPYDKRRGEVIAKAKSVRELASARSDDEAALRAAVNAAGQNWETALFHPLMGKARDFAVLIEPESAEVISVVPVDPWLEP